MRVYEILNEKYSHGRPVVCVDVQPAYAPLFRPNYLENVAQFLASQRGPILMYVNADETGATEDNVEHEIYPFWEEAFKNIGIDFFESGIFDNMTFYDKGYGYLRGWMDYGVSRKTIIAAIRMMYQQKVSSTEELIFPLHHKRTPAERAVDVAIYAMGGYQLTVGWAAIDQLKRYNNCYLIGGARDECLAEVALLMNAFNIRYTIIDSLIYG